jgi:outer membrane receptor protein involved in Fe transport
MRKAVIVLLAALLFAFAGTAWAQSETGQITGTITDATGAVVSDAKVTAKAASTGLTRETTTNSAGIYTIASLRPDAYEVTVEATGFKKLARRVEVAVGSNNEVSAQLEVGVRTETVEVLGFAEAVAVNTEDQTLSQVITSEQLNSLPTDPTRNPYALVATAGNVTEDCNSTRGAAPTGGCGYSINGLRSASTDILLDGAANVNTFTASVGQTIPLDSVAEFSVLTNDFTSEYGRASGGVVNLITKSGGNAFHGSAYEFNRVSRLSSNTFQNDSTGTPKSTFTRNNFGFALGGPAIKNKLFFFNNAEWIRVRSSALQQLTILDPVSIPLLAPASQAFFAAYGKLAPGVTTLKSGSCGGSGLTCDQVAFAAPSDAGGGNPQNTTMEVAKVDYNYSDRTTFSGRYASFKELDFPGVVNFSPYAGYNTGATNYDQNYLFNLTHVFSSSFVNSAKAVYNRINGPVDALGSAPVGPTLFTAGGLQTVLGSSLIFPGYNETTPGAAIPFGGPQNLYQFYDDASWTHGKHQFKFGGSYIHIRDNRVFGAYLNAVEQLGTNLSTGLSNLANGAIFQFQDAIFPQGKFPCLNDPTTGKAVQTPACTVTLPVTTPAFNRNFHYNDFAFYGQDSWKVRPRLTLNLGVRWEYYGVQHNANRALDSNFVMGPGSTIFNQVRNGLVELAQNGGVFGQPHYGNFGPRIGFAWDPFGGGKTSLRGGFGIGFERNFGNVTFNAIQNPPNYAVISLINSSANGAKGVGDVPFLPVFTNNSGPLGGTGSKALPLVSQRAINQNLKVAYAETWDLAIERQITPHSVVSIDYAGSHGVHLYDISNVNPSAAGSTYLGDARASNRLNFGYSNMNFRGGNAYSHYNGMTVSYRTNNLWNKGVNLNANYTWSHSLDNLSSTFTDSQFGTGSGTYYLGYLDGFNPKLNFGNSDYDIRHRFVLSGSWEIPWMKTSNNAIARAVLGGWGLGAVTKWRSGVPFSIFDATHVGGTNDPEWVPPGPGVARTGSAVSAGANFAPNTFNYITLPNTGGVVNNIGDAHGIPICSGLFHVGCRYSALGLPYPERNNYFGPGYWNADMSFFKNFKLTERFGLQFRAEMYNIFNHNNQYVNYTNLDVSSLVDINGNSTPFIQTEKGGPAGSAGTAFDERRNIQLGLKLTF